MRIKPATVYGFLASILLVTVCTGLVAWSFYQREKQFLQHEAGEQLMSISELKVNQLLEWRRERMSDGSFVYRNPRIATQILQLSASATASQVEYSAASWMNAMFRNGQYLAMGLFDSQGQELYSIPTDYHFPTALDSLLLPETHAIDLQFTDLFLDENQNPRMAIIAPIFDAGQHLWVGSAILLIDPDTTLYPMLQKWPVKSQSGEVVIARREKDEVTILNRLKLAHDKPGQLRLPLDRNNLPASRAVLGQQGVFLGKDYRNTPVLSVIRSIPGFDWAIICKTDLQEIYHPLRREAVLLTLTALFSSLTILLFIYSLRRRQTLRHLRKDALLTGQLRRLNRTYAVLSGINQAIVRLTDEAELMKEVSRIIIEAGEFPLTWIAVPEADGNRLIRQYLNGSLSAAIRDTNDSPEIEIPSNSPREEVFREKRIIAIDDIQTDSSSHVWAQTLIQNGIHSEIIVPLIRHGQIAYIMVIYAAEPGFFNKAEQQLIIELTENLNHALGYFDEENRRVRLEQELKTALENYRAVIEQAGDGIFICDANANYLDVNPYGCEMLGYTHDQIVGMNMREMIEPTALIQMEDNLKHILDGESVLSERLLRRSDGSYVPVEIVARRFRDNLILGMVRDVSERKRMVHALQESEGMYRSLFENMLNGFAYCRMKYTNQIPVDYCHLSVNKVFPALTGLKDAEGKWISELVPGIRESDPELFKIYGQVARTGQPQRFEINISSMRMWFSISVYSPKADHFVAVFENITDRKQAEIALQTSEERLGFAMEATNDGIFDLNLETQAVFCNPRYFSMLGFAPEEVAPGLELWKDLLHPDDRDHASAIMQEYFDKGRTAHELEFRLRTRSGSWCWVLSRGKLVLDKKTGRRIRLVGTHSDITARKETETALRQNEEMYRSLFENMLNGFVYCEVVYEGDRPVDFSYIAYNHMFEEIMGVHDILGKRITEVFPGIREADPNLFASHAKVAETGVPAHFEMKINTLDRWYSVSLYSPKRGTFVSIFEDITERRFAMERLKQIEWLLQPRQEIPQYPPTIYGDLGDFNRDRSILDAVGKETLLAIISDFLDLLGTSAAIYEKNGDCVLCVLASNWCRHLDEASYLNCGIENPAEAYRSDEWTCRTACRSKAVTVVLESGNTVDVLCPGGLHLYTIPIWLDGGIIGVMHFAYGSPPRTNKALKEIAQKYRVPLEDLITWADEYETRPAFITDLAKIRLQSAARLISLIVELRRTEDEVRSLNLSLEQRVAERTQQLESANRELEAFSYSVSHDLRAPLRAISGFSDILTEECASSINEEGNRLIGIIRQNTQRMGALIDDLLTFSRVSRQEMRSLPLDMNTMVGETLREVVGNLGNIECVLLPLPDCQGDPSLIRQVWANLLSNAVKFTSKTPSPRIEITGRIEGTERIYEVRDNGVGFDPKYTNKLFGTFQRLHSDHEFEGTGIGLALVKRIIQRHGGRVWADSQIHHGACFGFALPCITPGGET